MAQCPVFAGLVYTTLQNQKAASAYGYLLSKHETMTQWV